MAIKRKKRTPSSLEDVRKGMSTVLAELERICLDQDKEVDRRIRAANAYASVANSYRGLTEISNLEQRMIEIEERLNNEKS